jgi:DNA-directed RNA polymerase subunit RPC12/RpoP
METNGNADDGVARAVIQYTKCGCSLCGSPIEFPSEAIGEIVECPHCSSKTILFKAELSDIAGNIRSTLVPEPQEQPRQEPTKISSPPSANEISAAGKTVTIKIPKWCFSAWTPVAVILVIGAIVASTVGYVTIQKHRAVEREAARLAAIETATPREIRGQIYLPLLAGDQ